ALAFQKALSLTGHLAVDAGQDAIEKFHNLHLGTEPPPHGAELEPDDTCAYNEQSFGNLRQAERPRRGNYTPFIDLNAGKPRHVGTGGDDDGLRFDGLALPISRAHFD